MTTTLASLCSSSQDAAELVLQHVTLRDLAALAATCRTLHATVASLEAVWHAAAARQHVPQHPVLQAACVQTFLRTQHRVSSNIAAGRCSVREVSTAQGVLSPDRQRHATLEHDQVRCQAACRSSQPGAKSSC